MLFVGQSGLGRFRWVKVRSELVGLVKAVGVGFDK